MARVDGVLIETARRRMWLFLAYFAANSGPEFLDDIGERFVPDLCTPHTQAIPHGSIRTRMVAIRGNARGKGAADDLGKVSLRVPRIASRYDNATHGIAGAVPETSVAGLKEARILTQQRRKHCTRHEVLDRAVGRGSPETLPVSGSTLAIAGLAVFCLADAREESVPGILNIVKRAPRHDLKLLSGC